MQMGQGRDSPDFDKSTLDKYLTQGSMENLWDTREGTMKRIMESVNESKDFEV